MVTNVPEKGCACTPHSDTVNLPVSGVGVRVRPRGCGLGFRVGDGVRARIPNSDTVNLPVLGVGSGLWQI